LSLYSPNPKPVIFFMADHYTYTMANHH
jgi:hypothetical protein